MIRTRRERFDPKRELVAIKPLTVNGEKLQPGDAVSMDLPEGLRKRMWKARRCVHKGSRLDGKIVTNPAKQKFEDGFPITTEGGVLVEAVDFQEYVGAEYDGLSDDEKQIRLGGMVEELDAAAVPAMPDPAPLVPDPAPVVPAMPLPEGAAPPPAPGTPAPEPQVMGSQWGYPDLSETVKHRSKKAAREWWAANQGSAD